MNNNQMTHIPVLNDKLLFFLSPKDNKVYVDATFGAGNFTKAI